MSRVTEPSALSILLLVLFLLAYAVTIAFGVGILLQVLRALVTIAPCALTNCPAAFPRH